MRNKERNKWFMKFLAGEFTPPGHNYWGPGNVIDDHAPLNELDWVGYDHDNDYAKVEKQYNIPDAKWYHNWADDELLERVKNIPGWEARLGELYFKFKKFAAKNGFIEDLTAFEYLL